MSADWTGNTNSVFKSLGASNHTEEDRQLNDYYATEPKAIEMLLKLESFSNVLEPACGEGHLSEVLIKNNIHGKSCDLINRGFGDVGVDFLSIDNLYWEGDIITNPPFKYSKEFCEKALSIIPDGNKVAMFLKLQFMETKGRKQFFIDNPPKVIYVSASRLLCAKNGDFAKARKDGSAVAYAWYVWEKGFKGDTIVKWFN